MDRNGQMMSVVSKIHDAVFIPFYGGYLITDHEDIRLDRIRTLSVLSDDGSSIPIYTEQDADIQEAA